MVIEPIDKLGTADVLSRVQPFLTLVAPWLNFVSMENSSGRRFLPTQTASRINFSS